MKFLEGYYKTINGWYQTIKVTGDKIICEDPSGVDYEIVAEYDDFGRSDLEFVGGGGDVGDKQWWPLYILPFVGEAPTEIQEKTGQKNFNFKLKFLWNESHDESMKEAVRKSFHLLIPYF